MKRIYSILYFLFSSSSLLNNSFSQDQMQKENAIFNNISSRAKAHEQKYHGNLVNNLPLYHRKQRELDKEQYKKDQTFLDDWHTCNIKIENKYYDKDKKKMVEGMDEIIKRSDPSYLARPSDFIFSQLRKSNKNLSDYDIHRITEECTSLICKKALTKSPDSSITCNKGQTRVELNELKGSYSKCSRDKSTPTLLYCNNSVCTMKVVCDVYFKKKDGNFARKPYQVTKFASCSAEICKNIGANYETNCANANDKYSPIPANIDASNLMQHKTYPQLKGTIKQ